MTCPRSFLSRALAATALSLPLLAWAAPTSYFVPFSGQGNVSVFDAAAGTGGWVGAIDQVPDPAEPSPLALVSVVLFNLDAASRSLTGTFEFTTTDLLSTLTGELSGMLADDELLTRGGQISIDYRILGGTGQFQGASGYGLAFLDFNPQATGADNYAESGVLVFNVAAPSTAALLALALGLLAVGRSGGLSAAARSRPVKWADEHA